MIKINDVINFPENYYFDYSENVYSICTPEFHERICLFTNRFAQIQKREKIYQLPFQLYETFPHIEIKELQGETFTRKQDLYFFKTILKQYLLPGKITLEVGGWNSWLTNYLHHNNLKVITTDIFRDEINGLESKKHYKESNWISIQTDILKTDLYRTKFDVIIFNHCLQFLTDPFELIRQYTSLLKPNGILIILGASFHKNSRIKTADVLRNRTFYKDKYNFELQFYPSLGYFRYTDFDLFKTIGFNFLSYKFSFLGKLKKELKKEKGGILYFINK